VIRPERYYFWAYFMLMNAFWIVIPGGEFSTSLWERKTAADVKIVLLWQAFWKIVEIFREVQGKEAEKIRKRK
jgi:hypothetical protein